MDEKKTPAAEGGQTSGPVGTAETTDDAPAAASPERPANSRPKEIGGPQGPEPTRYGDWERNGRCSDF